MKRIALVFVMMALAAVARAQVVTPYEIEDIGPRRLQVKYLPQLKQVAATVDAHKFPFPFYFSNQLDVDLKQQLKLPQRSIRFEKYDGQTVLAMTGNYYAAYPPSMDENERVKHTFLDVMLPLLQAAVPRFEHNEAIASYAIEVSHHVRRKVMGIDAENPENVALFLPREAAEKLISNPTNPEVEQEALLEGHLFVDADPFNLWVWGDTPPPPAEKAKAKPDKRRKPEKEKTVEVASLNAVAPEPEPTISPILTRTPDWPVRNVSKETLADLQNRNSALLAKIAKEMDPEAHFVPYAPPAFVSFHQAAYLQLSITTTLTGPANGSQYELAALAFDEHIAHLVRPLLAYFPIVQDFDGVDFSTTVKVPGSDKAEAVEFVIPFSALRCFASYDCTGQQVINNSFVLINGDRASLDLQSAEAH